MTEHPLNTNTEFFILFMFVNVIIAMSVFMVALLLVVLKVIRISTLKVIRLRTENRSFKWKFGIYSTLVLTMVTVAGLLYMNTDSRYYDNEKVLVNGILLGLLSGMIVSAGLYFFFIKLLYKHIKN